MRVFNIHPMNVCTFHHISPFRYYAVVHPMKAQYLCTTSQAKKVTILVWLLALVLAIPTAIVRYYNSQM